MTSPKLHTSHLSANEEALLRCQTALDLKDREDYEGAQAVMRPLWKGFGEAPETVGLYSSVTAEVLLCVGILTGWIGNRNEIKVAQEQAKNLITQSIALYESIGDVKKMAAARAELAYCYWREGALDEARIMFNEALRRLTTGGNTRARALLRLAIVEWSASRYSESLRILEENAALFKKIPNHTLRGTYHNQLALVLRNLATEGKNSDFIQRAIREYEEADKEFKLAHNIVFRAHVKNNVGFLLYKLSRFKEAYQWLEQARRLTLSVRDKVRTAQINETLAQVLIAQKKHKEAESVARGAVRAFEKSGHQCLLAEALITHGIALARLGKREQAQFTFQRAVEVAREVGALNRAGVAALSLIEELDDLSRDTLHSAFQGAAEWLVNAEGKDLLVRFCAAAKKVLSAMGAELTVENATDHLLNRQFDLHQEVLKFEETFIRHVLAKVNGRLTRAAALMGMSYQGLAYVIQSRHPELLNERSPVRRRSRKA
jgi:tetratricopeptide (TPR) repeat protein